MSAIEETAVQTMTTNTAAQLVADRRAALAATGCRGRLRRMLARVNHAAVVSLDLAAMENAEPTPAVILPARPAAMATAAPDAGRIDKVA